ncbi:intracellular ribonuclease LX-like [Tripterygium wilfordii]|uniref:intracellular ribonuclease LX-like n=1 Tax=Tripterygium wilfordii TaxID=458696 RepID=UPI0018F7F382|nr:intracellular ribonuclease LX-like [Tripterygium wilfordii]
MNMYWVDVLYNNWVQKNLELWRKQFKRHGKCFDYPDHPLYYFNTALDFVRRVNLLRILGDASIFPRNTEGYLASYIANNISYVGGKRAQIRCNEDANGALQLYEVQICFKPNGVTINCEFGYNNCNEDDMINFPLP